ncbi:MAG TPA: hypothetical protein VF232_13705 [Gaiellaceae bacterium]
MRLAIAIALLLAVAAGCSSGSKSSEADSGPPPVPWISTKPPQVAERSPVTTPCRASDLRIPGPVKFVPRLQGGIALVTIRNVGRACRLTGRPRVIFVKKGGPVQVEKPIATTRANFPEATYPPSRLFALRRGESGALTVTWDNWCDPVVKGVPHVPPKAIRITLPARRGDLDADYNAVPPCVEPDQPTTIGVSRFQPSLVRLAGRWSDAFLRASVPGQPLHARRGGPLRFRVVLTNPSRTTVRFGRCPAYAQQLVPAGTVEVFTLNCSAANQLKPGGSQAFAMRVRVPKEAPTGPNGLFWELDPFGARAPQVHARVVIGR